MRGRAAGNTTIIDASRSLYGQSNSALGGSLKDAVKDIFGKSNLAGMPGAMTGNNAQTNSQMPQMAQTSIGSLLCPRFPMMCPPPGR